MNQNLVFNYKINQTVVVWTTIFIAICSFGFFYRNSIATLFNFWNDYGTYSHGYLTILLSAYLIYVSVKQSLFSYSEPSIISAIGILTVSIIWLFAYLASVNTIQMLCIPFLIFFTITYFCGINNSRTLLVPVFILLFTIPIWSLLLPTLQEIAVEVTNKLLLISNLDYNVIDNKIIFSRGAFEIEESCSGLRYLLVGILLSLVYGFLNYQSIWSMLVLVITTVIIMLIGNFIRILIVIGLGVVKGMDYPLVQDHEKLGWAIFAFLLIPLFTIGKYLDPKLWKKNSNSQMCSDVNKKFSIRKLFFVYVVYLLIISAAPLYASYLKNNVTKIATLDSTGVIPREGWVGPVMLPSMWEPDYILYNEHFSAQYKKQDKLVSLNAFLYTNRDPHGELINTNNQLVDNRKWKITETSLHQEIFDKAKESSIFVNKVRIQSIQTEDCLRVWYWFDVNNGAYTKPWQVKLNETIMVFKGESGSAIVSLSANCNGKPDKILNDFMTANLSQITNLIH